jgi:hypothetical protein
LVPVLGSTLKLATPVPVPLGVFSVSHEMASLAAQPQVLPDGVTVTVPRPPASVNVSDVEDSE